MIKIEELFLVHHEECDVLKERDIIKALSATCHPECQWYEGMAEIFPCGCSWWRPHRWFVEISARPSDFPNDTTSYWTHYWMYDKRALTLRGAWLKGLKQIDSFYKLFREDPTSRPDYETL